MAANYVAYTAPINPSGASPSLSLDQIWAALELKIRSGETFVGSAIASTAVLGTGHTAEGLAYIDREITFRDGNRKVKEHCVKFEPMKVEFIQPDGTRVMNIVSQGTGGETDLYMTASFLSLRPSLMLLLTMR
jgi:Domain of unknown function (DUF1857)